MTRVYNNNLLLVTLLVGALFLIVASPSTVSASNSFSILSASKSTTPDCMTDPSEAACVDYTCPEPIATNTTDGLCSSMPDMAVCDIRTSCGHGSQDQLEYCSPFSLMKIGCLDMPGMSECVTYAGSPSKPSGMCQTGTVVKQCAQPVPTVPGYMTLEKQITDICTSMPMSGCEKCMSGNTFDKSKSCQRLRVYSDLCLAMPDMSQCADWKNMCASDSNAMAGGDLCSADSSSSDPPMIMYFHASEFDRILFKSWITRTQGEYIGAWFACFAFAFVLEFLGWCRLRLDRAIASTLGVRQMSAPRSVSAQSSKQPLQGHSQTAPTGGCCGSNQMDAASPARSAEPSQCSVLLGYHEPSCCEGGPCSDPDAKVVRQVNNIFTARSIGVGITLQLMRALLYTVEVGQALLVMLIAMTFNVGLFLAVMAGAGVGFFVFKYQLNSVEEPSRQCH
eukprot:Nk52_evm8s165 gene=Nk52_evmTU8s165